MIGLTLLTIVKVSVSILVVVLLSLIAEWASPRIAWGTLLGYLAASLKKFYTFMNEKGLVEKEDLQDLKRTIKEEMPEWLETLRRFDDLSIEDGW